MIRAIRNWLRWRRVAIFHYWDGKRRRRADPIVIMRRIYNHEEFDWEKHGDLMDKGMDSAFEVTANMAAEVFDIPRVEHGGLPEDQCVDTIMRFMAWWHLNKKKLRHCPTFCKRSQERAMLFAIMGSSADSMPTENGQQPEPQTAS